MKTLRTFGIIVAVALAAIGLAVLPSVDDVPQARPGITVGSAPADPGAAGAVDAEPTGETSGAVEAVALPTPTAAEQPVRGLRTDTGLGSMEVEPSPEPPAPEPAPEPAPQQPRSSSGSSSSAGDSSGGSSGGSSSSAGGSSGSSSNGSSDGSGGGSSSSGSGTSTAPRPSGVCEWDDGERECDGDSHDDDDDGDDGDDGDSDDDEADDD